MSDDALPVPAFNEASIEKALVEAQGDLFTAADLLGHVTVQKLDRAIRASERLQNVYLAIKDVKALPEYHRISQERLEQEIARRLTVYRADALGALHELATMDVADNSAMAQVKFSAAARLSGPVGGGHASNDMEQTLRELNERYHQEAPRIRMTRTTIEIGPGGTAEVVSAGRVLEHPPQAE